MDHVRATFTSETSLNQQAAGLKIHVEDSGRSPPMIKDSSLKQVKFTERQGDSSIKKVVPL